MAIDFVGRHNDCFFDVALLSTVSNFSFLFALQFRNTFVVLN